MTNLMGMSYKDFVWKENPTVLEVSAAKNVRETPLPFVGSSARDLGAQKRRITGEGYFAGEDCWTVWQALRETYSAPGPGVLRLPGQEPFWALMDGLKLLGAAGNNLVKYSFSFLETEAGRIYDGAGAHRAKAGESLWDYAWKYRRPIEQLVAANPQIRDIEGLKEGEEVKIP